MTNSTRAIATIILGSALWGILSWLYTNAPVAAPAINSWDSDARERVVIFASSTAKARSALSNLKVDVVTAAKAVEDAGKKSGLTVKVGGSTTGAQQSGKNKPVLDSAFFAIDAQGTYTQLTELVQNLEYLPVPSQLDQFQLVYIEAGKDSRWRFSGRIKVFFSTDIL